jgi:hypothetical protein
MENLLLSIATAIWPAISTLVSLTLGAMALIALITRKRAGCGLMLSFIWVPVCGGSICVYGWILQFYPGLEDESNVAFVSLYGACIALSLSLLSRLFGNTEQGER